MRKLLSWVIVPGLVALAMLAGPGAGPLAPARAAAAKAGFSKPKAPAPSPLGPYNLLSEAEYQARVWRARGYSAVIRKDIGGKYSVVVYRS
jgi:hypothetical protein